MLRPTVCRLASLGIKQHLGLRSDFFTAKTLSASWCGALSLTRGRVSRLLLLLDLASTHILGSESRWSHDNILLSHIRNYPFCCLLRLARLRWRYSSPPPYGIIPLSAKRLLFPCLSLSLMLRPTVSWPVYLGIKHPPLVWKTPRVLLPSADHVQDT
jgi:hypothetical protein